MKSTSTPSPLATRAAHLGGRALAVAVATTLAVACYDTPHTTVVLENRYPATDAKPLVIFDAIFHAVSFDGLPLRPGAASSPVDTLPTSGGTAYVVLAPGWDPASGAAPKELVVLRSRQDVEVHLNDALTLAVDDTTFEGNCATGSRLAQDEADLVTQRVFASHFVGVAYDAATCTIRPSGAAHAP